MDFSLTSVWDGNDADLIEKMIVLYSKNQTVIVDVCCSGRVFWKGSSRKIIGVDINPAVKPDIVADFAHLPMLDDSSVDIVVFDPPHLPEQAASKNSSKLWETRYGITQRNKGDNVSPLFDQFFKEASRYIKPDGIVLAKIADLVHNHKYQWQHVDLILSGRSNGFTPCDLIVKTRKTGLHSSKWVNQKHARKFHCYWIVFRKGDKCE